MALTPFVHGGAPIPTWDPSVPSSWVHGGVPGQTGGGANPLFPPIGGFPTGGGSVTGVPGGTGWGVDSNGNPQWHDPTLPAGAQDPNAPGASHGMDPVHAAMIARLRAMHMPAPPRPPAGMTPNPANQGLSAFANSPYGPAQLHLTRQQALANYLTNYQAGYNAVQNVPPTA